MFLRIDTIEDRLMAGLSMEMSLLNNLSPELWKRFMPIRKLIPHCVGTTVYSLQIYPAGYFTSFNPATPFTKWALAEINDTTSLPPEIKVFGLPGGRYAVFQHKGAASSFDVTWKFIFHEWLPASGYQLDNRPHFEVLGNKYKNNDPQSEEEVWIPITG
ncbi:GyrI-like domain-containing protein [Flavihumibacter sp. CACIAM 22H1]|uniref:GyrI-like domain-containing protein n=1 Tax=Flavihumibacter sp. CACIAM 22H1 TaxID=1812911 RepID=UPI0007A84CFE|nr:GyrI-like domain-containing protein [Flavihumibacter sp. CACIAM 22H1]KYP14467.1 MAG: AraC family transcriptional regulator [Flavihumibacter sp. CACIAM 22H1]